MGSGADATSVPSVGAYAADLVVQARGDARAFDRLMRAHERQVFTVAWRLLGRVEDAQDAAQEVFLRLYRHLDRFDPTRPLAPWLYRVTINVCRDLGRRRNVRKAVSLEEAEQARPLESVDPASDPGAVASLAEERRIAEQALATLADKERAALVLRDVEGLTTAEVARALGSSEPTVRSQICRARLKMKKYRDWKLRRPLR
ncbi:MAG: sigma-70 family RNA polymerase sigma factor [bacterium]|nr:sigma-70 family RNA polymerase sigma factor [bacterium]